MGFTPAAPAPGATCAPRACSGPVSEILPFFERQLDFVCPVRKDIGSFLQVGAAPRAVLLPAFAGPASARQGGTRDRRLRVLSTLGQLFAAAAAFASLRAAGEP